MSMTAGDPIYATGANIVLIDDTGTVVYYGFAEPGSAVSAEKWRIMRQSTSANVTSFLFAEGAHNFSFVWNDRTSYTYS